MRGLLFVAIPIALGACTLLTSFDDLTSTPVADAAVEADATSDASPPPADAADAADAADEASVPAALLGDEILPPDGDYVNGNVAQIFPLVAKADGVVRKLILYVAPTTTASGGRLGIYDDAKGTAHDLLAEGVLEAPKGGAWNEIPVPDTVVTRGGVYWVAILGVGPGESRLAFLTTRDGGPTYSYPTNVTALPETWANGSVFYRSPVSVYGAP
jgi:hypothetical protein